MSKVNKPKSIIPKDIILNQNNNGGWRVQKIQSVELPRDFVLYNEFTNKSPTITWNYLNAEFQTVVSKFKRNVNTDEPIAFWLMLNDYELDSLFLKIYKQKYSGDPEKLNNILKSENLIETIGNSKAMKYLKDMNPKEIEDFFSNLNYKFISNSSFISYLKNKINELKKMFEDENLIETQYRDFFIKILYY